MEHSDLPECKRELVTATPVSALLQEIKQAPGSCSRHGSYIGVILPIGPRAGSVSECPVCVRERDDAQLHIERAQQHRDFVCAQLDTANVPARFRQTNLDDAPAAIRSFGADISMACNYGRNLIISGGVGTGKTYAGCALVVRAVEAGLKGQVMTLREFVMAIRSTWGRRSGPSEQDVLKEACGVDLFMLDDIGAGQCKEDEMVLVFDLIDGRNKRCKSTVVTTNLDSKALTTLLGVRIYDRLRDRGTWAVMDGETRRSNWSDKA